MIFPSFPGRPLSFLRRRYAADANLWTKPNRLPLQDKQILWGQRVGPNSIASGQLLPNRRHGGLRSNRIRPGLPDSGRHILAKFGQWPNCCRILAKFGMSSAKLDRAWSRSPMLAQVGPSSTSDGRVRPDVGKKFTKLVNDRPETSWAESGRLEKLLGNCGSCLDR